MTDRTAPAVIPTDALVDPLGDDRPARPARAAGTLTFDAAPLLDSVNTVGDYQRILAQQRAQHLARRTAR